MLDVRWGDLDDGQPNEDDRELDPLTVLADDGPADELGDSCEPLGHRRVGDLDCVLVTVASMIRMLLEITPATRRVRSFEMALSSATMSDDRPCVHRPAQVWIASPAFSAA
ncbi:hypothetical protein [Ktedonospora formicarum]|uniref:hypothetical protein n=1 Tax=Ktedonospora formicarum TaxID=2778364 RepID=UPI001C690414|nr:hypothetical protein [Ktedonospora formicarum]